MITLWIGFLTLVAACLALDLGVFHRRRKATGAPKDDFTLRQAILWSVVWVSLGASFSGVVYYIYAHEVSGAVMHSRTGELLHHDGKAAALQYLTAFVLEKSLSVDNLFVIGLVFKSFGVRPAYQHRVLFWGILGAILTRGAMILLGFELVARFEWLFYLFGAYLIYQGVKILRGGDDEDEDGEREEGFIEKSMKRLLPVSAEFDEDAFTTRKDGRFLFTPMLVCLLVVEATDVVFALDSIPAVLAVSSERFIAFTSNIFAVLGLRALYFVLAEMIERFAYLESAIAIILIFIGVKLGLHHWAHVLFEGREWISLTFIGLCLLGGIVWSWKKGGEEILRKSQASLPPPTGG